MLIPLKKQYILDIKVVALIHGNYRELAFSGLATLQLLNCVSLVPNKTTLVATLSCYTFFYVKI